MRGRNFRMLDMLATNTAIAHKLDGKRVLVECSFHPRMFFNFIFYVIFFLFHFLSSSFEMVIQLPQNIHP